MTAADFLPERRTLAALRAAAIECRGCPLYRQATQTVFGSGASRARLILLGEQPGDAEDREGRPFVGPAGRLLDDALDAAGIGRSDVYLTNAVKHFKWVPSGTRRLHKKPSSRELAACRPWWEAELDAVKPDGVVCLGATAAQTVLGRSFRITQSRGRRIDGEPWTIATWHPSAVLRAPDAESRREKRAELARDLRLARSLLT
jgi:uracil-DNA glycosylase family protein